MRRKVVELLRCFRFFHVGNKALPDLIPGGAVVSSSAIETEASAFASSVLPQELSHDEIIEVIHVFGERQEGLLKLVLMVSKFMVHMDFYFKTSFRHSNLCAAILS
jgi:hypothetical protein